MTEREFDLIPLLDYINPATLSYQDWVNVGMALKQEGYTAMDWDEPLVTHKQMEEFYPHLEKMLAEIALKDILLMLSKRNQEKRIYQKGKQKGILQNVEVMEDIQQLDNKDYMDEVKADLWENDEYPAFDLTIVEITRGICYACDLLPFEDESEDMEELNSALEDRKSVV